MDGAESLDIEEPPDAHGTWNRGDSEVVADEIDDHQVLGPVLHARRQVGTKLLVFVSGPATRPGALDRLRFRPASAVDFQEALRRGAQHRKRTETKECSIRDWIVPPQRPVSVPWVERAGRLDHVREA